MATWFISDLHLDPVREAPQQVLLGFLSHCQTQPCDAVYILGDLFEYWIGDDVLAHPLGQPWQTLIAALSQATAEGTRIYFIHGNRDFLIGQSFAEVTGVQLLPEQIVIDLYGTPTLIMHGDTLCSDDVDYLKMRQLLRNQQWQREFLSLSIEARIEQAHALRQQSQQSMQAKATDIMDVNQQTVQSVLQDAGARHLIHGHTHREATHEWSFQGRNYTRTVLGDWYQQGRFLRVDQEGAHLLADFR